MTRLPPPKPPRTLQILGITFVSVVVAVVIYTHQLIIPVFVGLIAWSKVWLKTLTPKLGLLLAKNSFYMQLRRSAVQASAHLFVRSHKPWRRFITRIRLAILESLKNVLAAYLSFPLWVRTAIAIGVLLATAGSSFAIFALLIIPQALLDWLGTRLGRTLSRLGITRFLSALWNTVVPQVLRQRLYMFLKWNLGRRQVRAAKRVHQTVVKTPPP